MRFSNLALTALFLAVASATQAQELVTNGGFETGNLTGFTIDLTATATIVPGLFPDYVHSGSWGLLYNTAANVDAPLSQTLATTPGDTETITFWQHEVGGLPGEVTLDFGGIRLLTLTDLSPGPWTEYTATAVATSTSTVLTFGLRQANAYGGLDDISVIQSGTMSTPEPGSVALLVGMGLSGAGFLVRRRRNVRQVA